MRVNGHCPMGCGQTLAVGEGGYVTCTFWDCPKPTAVSDILGDSEIEHIVKIGHSDFTIQHPLCERLDFDLFQCPLAAYLANLNGRPVPPGRYRAVKSNGAWAFEAVAQ